MKFRIKRYYDGYLAQVLKDNEWIVIGSPYGYRGVKDAKDACRAYKAEIECVIVEEFEL